MLLFLLKRELLRHWRGKQDLINPLVFFVITVSLFPLAVTPEGNLLIQMGPGIIWVAALLATMLSLESIYRDDYFDGTLELLMLQSGSAYQMVMAKVISHWISSGLPLIIISPLLAMMMHLNAASIWSLVLTLLLGTPVLSLLGAVGMGLTVSLKQGGVLLSLLVLPLYIPILIFGSNAITAASMGFNYVTQLSALAAFLVGSFSIMPLAAVAAIKVSIK